LTGKESASSVRFFEAGISKFSGRGVSMWRNLILLACLLAGLIPAGAFGQEYRKTVTVEVYLPEGARLFIESQEMKFTVPMRRFVSPPLPPGKYTYTIKAIIPAQTGHELSHDASTFGR